MHRLLFLLCLLAPAVAAQDEPIVIDPPEPNSLDDVLFHAIYDHEGPVFEATMRGVNGASIPIFLAAVPVHGLTMLATGENAGPTGRMALSQLGVVAEVFVIKNLIRRARPHVAHPDVESRQRGQPGGLDPFSFPSGHSATAFALATSFSLSYPEWYVIVPAAAWASLTAVARVWHGMHYPLDIGVGAVLGIGTAALVHALLPPGDDEELPGSAPPVVTVRIPLGR